MSVDLDQGTLLRVLKHLGLEGSPVYEAGKEADGAIRVLVPGREEAYILEPEREAPAQQEAEVPIPAGPVKERGGREAPAEGVDFSVIRYVGVKVTEALHLVGVTTWAKLDAESDKALLSIPSINRAVLRALREGARG